MEAVFEMIMLFIYLFICPPVLLVKQSRGSLILRFVFSEPWISTSTTEFNDIMNKLILKSDYSLLSLVYLPAQKV